MQLGDCGLCSALMLLLFKYCMLYVVQISAREDVLEVSQARFWELVPGRVIGSLSMQVVCYLFSFPLSFQLRGAKSQT